ncbi:MAG: hypothetical protein Ct9H90mP20_1110 [Candidatus Neomarinimicrobiota bacterium]|nr:MAG: hypothetical protein Ct9H90mP20_1110 [Candidatus Neomarinimicrobiota bacterium]
MIDKLQELILHFEDLEKQMIDPKTRLMIRINIRKLPESTEG